MLPRQSGHQFQRRVLMTTRSLIAGLLAASAGTTLAPTTWADAASRAEHRLSGEIEAVTVYRGQALVTRSLNLDFAPGIHEVVVSDLPAHLVEGSLHAEAGADVSIRSVRYREQPVRTDVREEVQQIDAQLDELRSSLARLSRAPRPSKAGKLTSRISRVLPHRTRWPNCPKASSTPARSRNSASSFSPSRRRSRSRKSSCASNARK
ncbi:MAG: DUF4140 domain-containing protein [Phycisphaerales bacterium]